MKIQFILKRVFLFMFGVSLFLFTSCEKDEPSDDQTTVDDPTGDDPANTSGRFSNNITCSVVNVPNDVGLSSYYSKFTNCSGVPVIAPAGVSDEALLTASETIDFILTDIGAIRSQLISEGNYAIIYPEGSDIGDLPENFFFNGGNTGVYEWNNNHKALASDLQSLICDPAVGYGHTLVHELGHMVDIGGIRRINSSFQSELANAYSSAMSSGKWSNTYAATNKEEYFAEAFTIWYGVNWIGPEGGDGFRNEIGTRAQLQEYDPTLYNLMETFINSLTNLPGCREPVISNASANCPSTIADFDGNVYEIVNIGPMCWLKENLNTTHYNDGTPIENPSDNSAWQNTTNGAWGSSDNDPNNDDIYGKLYNGYALASGKLCPKGWRVPTIQELQDLVNYGGGDHTSFNLRSTDLWDASDISGTNAVGFTALPAGSKGAEGNAGGVGSSALFGSSDAAAEGEYYSKNIFNDQVFVFTGNPSMNAGTTCRCIKDD